MSAMWFVYVLRSLKDGTLYTGSCNNLDAALRKHATGKVAATAKAGELSCEVYIGVASKKQATHLEAFLKTTAGNALLKKQMLLDE